MDGAQTPPPPGSPLGRRDTKHSRDENASSKNVEGARRHALEEEQRKRSNARSVAGERENAVRTEVAVEEVRPVEAVEQPQSSTSGALASVSASLSTAVASAVSSAASAASMLVGATTSDAARLEPPPVSSDADADMLAVAPPAPVAEPDAEMTSEAEEAKKLVADHVATLASPRHGETRKAIYAHLARKDVRKIKARPATVKSNLAAELEKPGALERLKSFKAFREPEAAEAAEVEGVPGTFDFAILDAKNTNSEGEPITWYRVGCAPETLVNSDTDTGRSLRKICSGKRLRAIADGEGSARLLKQVAARHVNDTNRGAENVVALHIEIRWAGNPGLSALMAADASRLTEAAEQRVAGVAAQNERDAAVDQGFAEWNELKVAPVPPHPRVAAAASLPPEAQDAAKVAARKDILAGARADYGIGGAPPADKASVKRDDDALAKLLGSI